MSVLAQTYDIIHGFPFPLLFSRHPCFENHKTENIYSTIWYSMSDSFNRPPLKFLKFSINLHVDVDSHLSEAFIHRK